MGGENRVTADFSGLLSTESEPKLGPQIDPEKMPKWRNGRRAGLKILCPQGRVGSTPTFGTKHCLFIVF